MKKISAVLVITAVFISCEKEYSYENGPADPVVIPVTDSTDTVNQTNNSFLHCSRCDNAAGTAINTWRFETAAGAVVCGEVDTAFVLNHERDVLTFFGPSYCGSDSGLIFTVNLSSGLTGNAINIPASFTAYYYYHTGNPNILVSLASQPFTLMVTSYNHSSRIASGTFSGTAYLQNQAAVAVTRGKFSFFIQ